MMHAIELKNVSVVYGEGTPFRKVALDNITLGFEEKTITGVIGHTGSGKSTLATLLNGLLAPTSGTVMLHGTDIWARPKEMRSVRARVGLVFQYPEYQLFAETVGEDIAFGPKNIGLDAEEVTRRVKLSADFCGLSRRELERSPFEISGGQKRRAAIAGVLAMKPEILVLDEPAAGLDPRGREDILGGLMGYKNSAGATMILVSHSMEDVARYADRIAVIKQGSLFMQGSVGEIFMQPEKLFDSSLDLPQITKLFVELKKRGIADDTDVYTVNYALEVLLKKLRKA